MTSEPASILARPRVAAGVLFFDALDRVLLVVPAYKAYREIPGGYLERGETPAQAAVREVREELGITPPIGRLLVVDWAPSASEGDKLLFVFDGGVLTAGHLGKVELDPAELTGYDFHPADRVGEVTIPRLVRRIRHGARAREDGTTRYLEHGELVTTATPATAGGPGACDRH